MFNGYNISPVAAPEKREEDKRDKPVTVYYTSKELADVRQLARESGLTLAAYIRMMSFAKIKRKSSIAADDIGAGE
ncbi:MAG: hypothetical protein WCL57_15025 [Chloroflexota bacterium]|jgi:hypothetical protein